MNTVELRIVTSGAEQAARVLSAVAREGGQLGSTVARGARDAAREMDGFGASARRVFEIFTGVNLAGIFQQGVVAIRQYAVEASKLAREAKSQEAAFLALSQSIGVSGKALADRLKAASGDIIDVGDAMKAASKGLLEGLQPQQVIQLMEASRQLSKLFGGDVIAAFNSVAEAVSTGNTRMLRQIGIVVDADAATKAYAQTLGVEADQLTSVGRAQAVFLATMEKARPVMEAMSGVSNEQNEILQKLAMTWKEWQQSFGNVLNDAAGGLLGWLTAVQTKLSMVGPDLEEIRTLWRATWDAALIALRPVADILANVLIPTLKVGAVAMNAFGVGVTAAFTVLAGPIAYISSILDDLASSKWPSHTRATLEANAAVANARVALAEAVQSFQNLKDGTTSVVQPMKESGAAIELGTNRLGSLTNQINTGTLPSLDSLVNAMRGLSDQFDRSQLFPREAEVLALTQPIAKAFDAIKPPKGAEEAWKQLGRTFDAWAQGVARATIANKDQRASHEALVKAMAESEKAYGDIQDALQATAPEQKRLDDILKSSQASLDLFVANLGKSRLEIAQNTAAVELFGESFASLGPSAQEAADKLARVRIQRSDLEATQAFTDELLLIGQTAQLLGRDFDLAAANLDAVKRRMLEIARVSRGEFHPEMERVVAEFQRLNEFVKTRDLFQDVFSSVQGGIEQMVRALQSGTRSWSTFGQVAIDVLRSIALEVVNTLLKNALNPLVKELSQLATVALSGTPSSIAGAQEGTINPLTGAPAALVGEPTSFLGNVQSANSLLSSAQSLGGLMTGITNIGANWSAGTSFTGSLSNVFMGTPAVTGELGLGTPAIQGMFGGATTAFGTALAGVAAGLAVFDNILNLAAGNVESFAFRVGGAVVGGVAAGFLTGGSPMGILAGIAIGDFLGGLLADLFGVGPSEDWLKFGENLQGTLQREQEALIGLQQNITNSKSLEDLAKAVSDFRGAIEAAGVGGFVASSAGLGLFGVPGIPGATGTDHEGGLSVDFGPAIQQINDVIRGVLDAFIDQITTEMPRAAEKLLPPELFEAFVSNTIGRLKTEFEALTTSSTATVEDLTAFQNEMQAIAQQVIVFDQLGVQIAALSGDIVTLTERAKLTAEIVRDQAAKAIEDAKSRLAEAISGPEIVAAAQQLQQAILAKYELERKLIADIEARIAGLLSGAGQSFIQNIGIVVAHAIGQGDTGPLGDFLNMMESIASQASSTALKLFAVQAAFGAITGSIPGIVSSGLASSPASLVQGVVSAAGPSLGTLGNMFASAQSSGDLEGALAILATGAQLLQQLAAASIAGVRQWEQQQEAAARATHARMVGEIEANRDRLIALADGMLETMIETVERNAESQIDALETQRTAIQRNLDLSREWARVSESLARFIVDLKLGPQAPPDPMGQFLLAQDLFNAAGSAFATNATPEGAANVQQSAADLLAAAQLVYTRPSPEYRALFEGVMAQLESVQATAAAFVTPEEEAVRQLESIDRQITEIRDSAQQQIDAFRDMHADFVKATNDAAQMEIDGLNAQLEGWLRGMHEEAEATVRGINAGLASAMAWIAGQQSAILGALIGSQEDLLNSITGGKDAVAFQMQAQKDTVAELFALRSYLQGVIGGIPTGELPATLQPVPTHHSGTMWTRRGLANLDEGEVVLAGRNADDYRAGRSGGGSLPPLTINIYGATDTEKVKREVLEAVDRWAARQGRDRYKDDR